MRYKDLTDKINPLSVHDIFEILRMIDWRDSCEKAAREREQEIAREE